MTNTFTGRLEKIDDYRWRIPTSYLKGMRVPGIIYSDEKMLSSILRDNAPQQIANAAHLPGIVKASMAMPDIHWGYGLPIGGVVATDIEEGGVITPGGVGYDINCLSGESKVLLDNGAYIEIKDFEEVFGKKTLACFNFIDDSLTATSIVRFLKIKPKNRVLEVKTLNGSKITATEDHPFWTPDGMKQLKELSVRDLVAIYPFEGVPYEQPSDKVILSEGNVREFLFKRGKDSRGRALEQIIMHLKKRSLLPLKYNSPQLPYILKIMGYNLGDGNIFFNKKRGKGCVSFYGEKEDLKKIQTDIEKIGFKCSKTYSRERAHKIRNNEFISENCSCKVGSSSFAALLACLGAPVGNKTEQSFRVPCWIREAPKWQVRLFLAAFFGAEMSSPKTMTGHGCNFYCPVISINKKTKHLASGRDFLSDLSDLLAEFGIASNRIGEREEYRGKRGKISIRLRLALSNKTENLIKLYSKVGFEYNQKRTMFSNAAVQYLKMKKSVVAKRKLLECKAKELAGAGLGIGAVCRELQINPENKRFIERSVYSGRKNSPRVGRGTITFNDFFEYYTRGLGFSGMIWDRIETIKRIDFNDYVYDFTVSHKDHNFIASSFVVSNCGVRLMGTDLEAERIKGRVKELVDVLFSRVPAGVGSTGKIKVGSKEEKQIMIKGAKWAVEKGYGWEEDLLHSEEGGAIEGADPSKVSDRAYKRGSDQSGTLGSGNHFLEVQEVDEIYNEGIANKLGIKKGQVTVMIHTGSRGLGHQICSEYAQRMVSLLSKYKISIPDKQLSCVPVKSEEGQAYLGAMRSAANYAWCNRQAIMHLSRESFEHVFGESAESLGMHLIYDVAHNIAKIEKYNIDGEEKTLCVHRKGATRAFPPGHEDLPEDYREIGQPVIIPGDMGRCSYLLAGTASAVETFYSTCHGAGRLLSRKAAIRNTKGRSISRELLDKGIFVRWTGRDTLREEVSDAYKDVTNVVDIVQKAGISEKIARMRPLGVIKG